MEAENCSSGRIFMKNPAFWSFKLIQFSLSLPIVLLNLLNFYLAYHSRTQISKSLKRILMSISATNATLATYVLAKAMYSQLLEVNNEKIK